MCPLLRTPPLRAALVLALAAAASLTPLLAADPEWRSFALTAETSLRAAVVLPAGYDSTKSYPVLLVLPPGTQGEKAVLSVLDAYFATVGPARGWIVVAPAAPAGSSFQGAGSARVVQLAAALGGAFKLEGGKAHLAGVANGGKAAFDAALARPDAFLSLTVLPGVPDSNDPAVLAPLKAIPVRLFVGSEDIAWHRRSQETADRLQALGGDVSLTNLPSHKSFIRHAALPSLFDALDALRRR